MAPCGRKVVCHAVHIADTPRAVFHRARRTSDSLGHASLASLKSTNAAKARCRKLRFSFKCFREKVEELEYLASPEGSDIHFSNGDGLSLNLKHQMRLQSVSTHIPLCQAANHWMTNVGQMGPYLMSSA